MANSDELHRASETFMNTYGRSKESPGRGSHKTPRKRNSSRAVPDSEVGFQECNICFCNLSDAVSLPCGHGGLCYDCAVKVLRLNTQCSLCRKTVKQVLKVDLNTVFETYIRVLSTTHIVPASNQAMEERKSDVMFEGTGRSEQNFVEEHLIYTIENPKYMFETNSPGSSMATFRHVHSKNPSIPRRSEGQTPVRF